MYALVVAGLLNVQEDKFSNTPEAEHFLVKGNPAYMGAVCGPMSRQWESTLKTAESIRTGIPQSRLDFSSGSEDELEKFLRMLHPQAFSTGRELTEQWDFSPYRTLADIGGGSGGLAVALTERCPQIKAIEARLNIAF